MFIFSILIQPRTDLLYLSSVYYYKDVLKQKKWGEMVYKSVFIVIVTVLKRFVYARKHCCDGKK